MPTSVQCWPLRAECRSVRHGVENGTDAKRSFSVPFYTIEHEQHQFPLSVVFRSVLARSAHGPFASLRRDTIRTILTTPYRPCRRVRHGPNRTSTTARTSAFLPENDVVPYSVLRQYGTARELDLRRTVLRTVFYGTHYGTVRASKYTVCPFSVPYSRKM